MTENATAPSASRGRPCTAVAGTNIALVKYWGKRDAALNLPATGSLSLTLDALRTRTSVELHDGADSLSLDGVEQSGKALGRVTRFLDRVAATGGAGSPRRG